MTGADAIYMERVYATLVDAAGDLHDAFQDDAPDRTLGILGDMEDILSEVRARVGHRVADALLNRARIRQVG